MTPQERNTSVIDSQQVSDYKLQLWFTNRGCKVSVFDGENSRINSDIGVDNFFTSNDTVILNLLNGIKELKYNFKEISIICESEHYTFVPSTIFDPNDASLYLTFQKNLPADNTVLYNRLMERDIVTVFSLPFALHTGLRSLLPQAHIIHHLSYFINSKIPFINETCVYVWVREKVMDLVLIINGSPALMNTYSYSTPEDFTYYVLTVFEQYSLNVEFDKVMLYNVSKSDGISLMIEKYVHKLIIVA